MDRYVISYADTPPTLNRVGASGSWRTFHRHKKHWQNLIGQLLMVERVPRRKFDYVEVSAVLSFPRAVRRDAENFSALLGKSCADAIVNAAILEDDTPDHYRFTGLTFEKGPKKTTLTLDCRRATGPDA